MYEALLLIARATALACGLWGRTVGRECQRSRHEEASSDSAWEEKGGGDFLEKRGNVWNEKESFTLSSNRTLFESIIAQTLDAAMQGRENRPCEFGRHPCRPPLNRCGCN